VGSLLKKKKGTTLAVQVFGGQARALELAGGQKRYEVQRRWLPQGLDELVPRLPRGAETLVFIRLPILQDDHESWGNSKEWNMPAEVWADSDDIGHSWVTNESQRWLPYDVFQSYQGWRVVKEMPETEERVISIRHLAAEFVEPILVKLEPLESSALKIQCCEVTALEHLLRPLEQPVALQLPGGCWSFLDSVHTPHCIINVEPSEVTAVSGRWLPQAPRCLIYQNETDDLAEVGLELVDLKRVVREKFSLELEVEELSLFGSCLIEDANWWLKRASF
jgi:hypothetical protein